MNNIEKPSVFNEEPYQKYTSKENEIFFDNLLKKFMIETANSKEITEEKQANIIAQSNSDFDILLNLTNSKILSKNNLNLLIEECYKIFDKNKKLILLKNLASNQLIYVNEIFNNCIENHNLEIIEFIAINYSEYIVEQNKITLLNKVFYNVDDTKLINRNIHPLQTIFYAFLNNKYSKHTDFAILSSLFKKIDIYIDNFKNGIQQLFVLNQLGNRILCEINLLPDNDKKFMEDAFLNVNNLEKIINVKSKFLNLGTKIKDIVSQEYNDKNNNFCKAI